MIRQWMSGVCNANGISIHYLRTGGDKIPLVALHGLTGSGACWSPVARLLEGDYDVVMPDARGHGKSSAPPHGYLYSELARDVIGLIEGLGLVEPVILGHSMGGMTAAVAARRLGTAIRAVVLAEPTFISPERQCELFDSNIVEQHRRLLKSTKDAVLADLRVRRPHRSPELLEKMAAAKLATHISAFEVLSPPNPDYRELIEHIRVPILLINGSDGIISNETAREIKMLNPRLSHANIPEGGHGLPFDHPNGLAAAIHSFLASLGPRQY